MKKIHLGEHRPPKGQQGSALVTTLFIVTILTIFGVGLLQLSLSSYKQANAAELKNQARNHAEAGVNLLLRNLPAGGVSDADFAASGTFNVVYQENPSNSDEYVITSTGTAGPPGNRWQAVVKATVKKPFNIWTWPYAVYSGGNATFNGAVDINGPVNVEGVSDTNGMKATRNITITKDNIPVPQLYFNTEGLTKIEQGGGILDGDILHLDRIPASTSFYVNYNGALTLSGSTKSGVKGIIEADTIKESGKPVVGSSDSPVILVVREKLKLSGNATVYGLIYGQISEDTEKPGESGTPVLNGMLIATTDLKMVGSSKVIIDPRVQSSLASLNYIAPDKRIRSWQESYSKI